MIHLTCLLTHLTPEPLKITECSLVKTQLHVLQQKQFHTATIWTSKYSLIPQNLQPQPQTDLLPSIDSATPAHQSKSIYPTSKPTVAPPQNSSRIKYPVILLLPPQLLPAVEVELQKPLLWPMRKISRVAV